MVIIKFFKGIRLVSELVLKIVVLLYDVMNSDEVREMVVDNLYLFFYVDRVEVDLDFLIDVYDKRVYEKVRENFDRMIKDGEYI